MNPNNQNNTQPEAKPENKKGFTKENMSKKIGIKEAVINVICALFLIGLSIFLGNMILRYSCSCMFVSTYIKNMIGVIKFFVSHLLIAMGIMYILNRLNIVEIDEECYLKIFGRFVYKE